MEYILLAVGDAQTPIKTRLSKLRHMDSLFFYLLIVALLFFQIFQQNQLRQELQPKRVEELIEEILTQRIPQLERTVQQIKIMLNQQRITFHQGLQENKQITLELAKQLGLPIPNPNPINTNPNPNPTFPSHPAIINANSYEVIQMEPNNDDSDGDEHDGNEQQQIGSFKEQEVIRSRHYNHSCTYLQYLREWQPEKPQIQRPQPRTSLINTSSHTKKNSLQIDNHSLEQLRRMIEEIAKVVILGVLIAGVLLLTFQKRRKGRYSKTYLRRLLNCICPEQKKKVTKESKEGKQWGQQKTWSDERQWVEKEKMLL